jgi:hypothetical protein
MLLDYGKPEVAMPAVLQSLLGILLGIVVVGTVGIAVTASQGPVGGICGGPAAALSLGLWAGRLRRGEYYRPLSAAIGTGSVLALVAVGAFIRSRNWG